MSINWVTNLLTLLLLLAVVSVQPNLILPQSQFANHFTPYVSQSTMRTDSTETKSQWTSWVHPKIKLSWNKIRAYDFKLKLRVLQWSRKWGWSHHFATGHNGFAPSLFLLSKIILAINWDFTRACLRWEIKQRDGMKP